MLPITVILGPVLLLLIREFLKPDSVMEENSDDKKEEVL